MRRRDLYRSTGTMHTDPKRLPHKADIAQSERSSICIPIECASLLRMQRSMVLLLVVSVCELGMPVCWARGREQEEMCGIMPSRVVLQRALHRK